MRGTPCVRSCMRRFRGIIPAYAGNTSIKARFCAADRDHPRICGEHSHTLKWKGDIMGSSPHMRGTLSAVVSDVLFAGIIPAYAGNTSRVVRIWTWCRDHPRICGEHYGSRSGGMSALGSSPHMRGTLVKRQFDAGGRGIIPAYAGNTLPWRQCPTIFRDHPRICGEHVTVYKHVRGWKGSSPHMRGTQQWP